MAIFEAILNHLDFEIVKPNLSSTRIIRRKPSYWWEEGKIYISFVFAKQGEYIGGVIVPSLSNFTRGVRGI